MSDMMRWTEELSDPAHRARTEKIIDIILMRSCEFVCTIRVSDSTVNFRFMSDEMRHIAPHWRQNVDMDFEENMCGSLASLVSDDFRSEMLRTFRIPYIVEQLSVASPYITTFDLAVGPEKTMRKQLQYYWIDDSHEEILCIQTDISVAYERELYNERLRREASIDPLTSLSNRRGIRQILDDLADRQEKDGEPFSMAMCDIDFFKKVNDTYGHDGGDAVLQQISREITEFMTGRGAAGRMGGEEFLIAFENCTEAQCTAQLEELRQRIAAMEVPYNGQIIRVTMTFGAAGYDPNATIHTAISRADERLYQGKNSGRNRVVGG